jgi:hypothetical protein
MCIRRRVKYPAFLSDLKETWIFLDRFSRNTQISDSWKSVQRELSCSMWTYGRMDMTKLIVAFRNCAIARKKSCMYVCMYVCKYVCTYVRMCVRMYVYNGCNVDADTDLHCFRVEPGCVLLTPIGKHVCFISGSEVSETGRDPRRLETSKTVRKKSNWFWYVSIWLCRWYRFT